MTTTDKAISKKVSKAEAMERISVAVSTLSSMSGGLPEINEPLAEIHKLSRAMVKMIEYRDQLLARAEALIDATQAANGELTKQRDAIAQEMQQLIDDLKAGDFFSDTKYADGKMQIGVKGEIYSTAVEQHNGAFWESLPYDMMETLRGDNKEGGDWQHWNASTLYSLITDDSFEVADGLGVDEETVLAFRQVLLDMVRKIEGRDE
jgi:hypothetical protein